MENSQGTFFQSVVLSAAHSGRVIFFHREWYSGRLLVDELAMPILLCGCEVVGHG